jgi:cell division protein FtsB
VHHLSSEQIELYRSRRCNSEELFAFSKHIAECSECTRKCLSGNDLKTIYSALKSNIEIPEEEFEHPAYEAIEDYVDGKADAIEAQILDVHLADCAQCGTIERGLRQIRSDLLTPSHIRTLQSVWPTTLLKAAVFVLASLLLIVIASWIPLRSRTKTLESQLSSLKNENASLKKTSNDLRSQLKEQNDGSHQLSTSQQNMIARALSTRTLVFPNSLNDLIGSRGQLMGTSNEQQFQLLRPVGTRVELDKPVFEWTSIAGAENYRVSVFDVNFKSIANSPPLNQTQWNFPGQLKRGQQYLWQVVAIKKGQEIKSPVPPNPPAMFEVITEPEFKQLETLFENDRIPHLTRGILFANYGLLDRAKQEFLLARNQTPWDASSADQFLEQIQSLHQK